MGYSQLVRRDLVAVAAVASLLWALNGVSVLALVLHQHSHHAEAHDHRHGLQTAVHGHAHQGTPDHDHELSAPLSASRASSVVYSPGIASEGCILADGERELIRSAAVFLSMSREHRPPPYLMHCALLT